MPSPPPSSRFGTRVWSAGRLLVLAVALAVTFGAFFLTAFRVTNRAREVAVPDLKGMTIAAATTALADEGLALKVESRRADPKVPADRILAQEPEPGAVLRRQRTVRVRVSDGQRDPIVPSVVGQAERTAEIVLAQAQIGIASRSEIHDGEYPAGTVIAQDPPEKQRAGQVNLLVNRGQGGVSFVMPDLIGTPASRVVDLLRRRGFRVSVSADVPYPGVPSGTVVRQRPQPGFQIGAGEPVVLEVSR
ncbi:MAG: PASTA domain-containing protein [Acidobacteria bacterium]|nr:PASTA domain-containing protein [Acidobacteriota bacterium]